MSPKRAKCLLKNPSFIQNLSKLLESYDNDTYLQELLELILEVYEFRDDQSQDNLKVDRECVRSFCVAFGNFEFPDPNHALLIEALYTLLNKHMPVNAGLQMMEDKKWAPDFIRSVRVNKSAEQSMALRLLYFLYVHCESKKNVSRKELNVVNLDRIVAKEIMRTLEKHRNTIDSSEGVFDRLKWILTISEEPLTRDFVEWIIKEFESEEEKKDRPEKRRRTCSV
ncbi:hypothetical protein CAEBREN_06831 [Caenorhabditis brenneri]|uniref:Uncharacterized protein n=1 Tax=Caenorhabditis brenneri TaxID=135651 RepID=G0PDQ7_CAEBE|nr:hypothetical protein CAEBREN_06831 [Caenorhabditis brenneri]